MNVVTAKAQSFSITSVCSAQRRLYATIDPSIVIAIGSEGAREVPAKFKCGRPLRCQRWRTFKVRQLTIDGGDPYGGGPDPLSI